MSKQEMIDLLFRLKAMSEEEHIELTNENEKEKQKRARGYCVLILLTLSVYGAVRLVMDLESSGVFPLIK